MHPGTLQGKFFKWLDTEITEDTEKFGGKIFDYPCWLCHPCPTKNLNSYTLQSAGPTTKSKLDSLQEKNLVGLNKSSISTQSNSKLNGFRLD